MELIDNLKEGYKKFKAAKSKSIGDYEKEEAAKKAEKAYTEAGGPLVKKAKGGSVKSKASSRGDGCCTKGKTKGRMV